jgi:nucleoside-triphosphatase THEP1
MQNCGIFGTTLSGKTTLAKRISLEFFNRYQIKSLVLDPFAENWGNHALVLSDEEKFWEMVWKAQGYLIIVDEAGLTINRDKDLKSVFTRLRHNHNKLLVVGHSSSDLLPVMRQSLDTLYLFRHSKKSAAVWAEVFTEERLLAAEDLQQYEFLRCQLYHKPVKSKLKI